MTTLAYSNSVNQTIDPKITYDSNGNVVSVVEFNPETTAYQGDIAFTSKPITDPNYYDTVYALGSVTEKPTEMFSVALSSQLDPVTNNLIIKLISDWGLDPTQPIDMNDPSTRLIMAIILTYAENGRNLYNYDAFIKGCAKSSGVDPDVYDSIVNPTSLGVENSKNSGGYVSPATPKISGGGSSVPDSGVGIYVQMGVANSLNYLGSPNYVPLSGASFVSGGVYTGGNPVVSGSSNFVPGTPSAGLTPETQTAINAFADRWGINPNAATGVLAIESGFKTDIAGGAGGNYNGIFQLGSGQIPSLTAAAGFSGSGAGGGLTPAEFRQLGVDGQLRVMDQYYLNAGIKPNSGFFTGDAGTDSSKMWALQLAPGNAKNIDYNNPNAVISRTNQASTISAAPGVVTVGSVQGGTIARGGTVDARPGSGDLTASQAAQLGLSTGNGETYKVSNSSFSAEDGTGTYKTITAKDGTEYYQNVKTGAVFDSNDNLIKPPSGIDTKFTGETQYLTNDGTGVPNSNYSNVVGLRYTDPNNTNSYRDVLNSGAIRDESGSIINNNLSGVSYADDGSRITTGTPGITALADTYNPQINWGPQTTTNNGETVVILSGGENNYSQSTQQISGQLGAQVAALQDQGIKVVLIQPSQNINGSSTPYEATNQVAEKYGVEVIRPTSYPDKLHPDYQQVVAGAKELGINPSDPNVKIAGNSVAVGTAQAAGKTNPQEFAKTGANLGYVDESVLPRIKNSEVTGTTNLNNAEAYGLPTTKPSGEIVDYKVSNANFVADDGTGQYKTITGSDGSTYYLSKNGAVFDSNDSVVRTPQLAGMPDEKVLGGSEIVTDSKGNTTGVAYYNLEDPNVRYTVYNNNAIRTPDGAVLRPEAVEAQSQLPGLTQQYENLQVANTNAANQIGQLEQQNAQLQSQIEGEQALAAGSGFSGYDFNAANKQIAENNAQISNLRDQIDSNDVQMGRVESNINSNVDTYVAGQAAAPEEGSAGSGQATGLAATPAAAAGSAAGGAGGGGAGIGSC